MSQPKGSVGVALTIAAVIVISVTSVGYYQFVVCTPTSCVNSTSSTSTEAAACTPPACISIQIVVGASQLTDTAYSPDVVKLVVGVNNTFEFHNNDSSSGGTFHSATAKTCPQQCPFDTGIIGYNTTSGPYTITTAGTYKFYCEVHPTTMIGEIDVTGGSGAAATQAFTSTTASTSTAAPLPANSLVITMNKGSSADQSSSGYSPNNPTVVIGQNNTIVWKNNDIAGHTIKFTSAPAGAKTTDSDLIGPGSTFDQTLTVPGTYTFICTLHSWMKGAITVKSA